MIRGRFFQEKDVLVNTSLHRLFRRDLGFVVLEGELSLKIIVGEIEIPTGLDDLWYLRLGRIDENIFSIDETFAKQARVTHAAYRALGRYGPGIPLFSPDVITLEPGDELLIKPYNKGKERVYGFRITSV